MVLLAATVRLAWGAAETANCFSSCATPSSRRNAWGRKRRPTSFSCRRLPTRSNRRVESCDSSSLSAALVADCDSEMDSAAAVVLPQRATAQKIWS